MHGAVLIYNASGEESHQSHSHLMHDGDSCMNLCKASLFLNLQPGSWCNVLPASSGSYGKFFSVHHRCWVKKVKHLWAFFLIIIHLTCFVLVVPSCPCSAHIKYQLIQVKNKNPSEGRLPNVLLNRKNWHFSLFVVRLTFENITY